MVGELMHRHYGSRAVPEPIRGLWNAIELAAEGRPVEQLILPQLRKHLRAELQLPATSATRKAEIAGLLVRLCP